MDNTYKDFEKFLIEEGKSLNSIKSYLQNLREYFKWFQSSFGKTPEKLYRPNILDFKSYLINVRKIDAKSVNQKLSTLRKFNGFLIYKKVQEDEVLLKKDLVKIQGEFASPAKVTESEVKSFLQTMLEKEGKRDYALVTLLAYTGVRISEALNLEMNDFNLVSSECIIRSGKGGKQRNVPLHSKVVNALKEYLNEREKYKRAGDSNFLFLSQQSPKLERSSVNKLFKKHSNKITPHQLRHFFCTYALENGLSIHEVAHIAGHTNIHTTMIYTNPDREKLKAKMEQL